MAGQYPKVSLRVEDRTITQGAQPVGVPAIAVQTQRGEVGKVYFLRSWQEWRENLGEIVDPNDTLGPIYAKRIFDNGGQLYATRIVHFTDINDINSYTPIEADGDNGGIFNFAELVVSVDGGANTITIRGDFTDYIDPGDAHVVNLQGGGTSNITVDAGGATYAGGFTTIEYVALGGSEASGDELTWSKTLTATLEYEASSPGTWGNVIQVEIKRAASGLANALDIFVTSSDPEVVGSDLNESFTNFPTVPTAGDITSFNETMKLLRLTSVLSTPIGVVPPNLLTGGTDDYGSVDEVDYIGSTTAGNGIRAFDDESGFVRIAVPELASNLVDNELVSYVNERKDCLAILRTPESIDARAAIDYRNAAGAYAGGVKIDDWRGTMLYGGIKIISPFPGDNGAELTISWIADFLGLSATKDRVYGPWINTSNFIRGTLKDVRDIVYNINTTARFQEREDLTAAGLFPIIKDKDNGQTKIVAWGYKTLQVAESLLQFQGVTDLLIFISNGVTPLAKSELMNPNGVLTWKAIYRKVNQFMLDAQNRGAFEAFRYEGDQDVDNVADAQINSPTAIAQGIYKFNLFVQPNPELIEVQIALIVTQAGTSLETALQV